MKNLLFIAFTLLFSINILSAQGNVNFKIKKSPKTNVATLAKAKWVSASNVSVQNAGEGAILLEIKNGTSPTDSRVCLFNVATSVEQSQSILHEIAILLANAGSEDVTANGFTVSFKQEMNNLLHPMFGNQLVDPELAETIYENVVGVMRLDLIIVEPTVEFDILVNQMETVFDIMVDAAMVGAESWETNYTVEDNMFGGKTHASTWVMKDGSFERNVTETDEKGDMLIEYTQIWDAKKEKWVPKPKKDKKKDKKGGKKGNETANTDANEDNESTEEEESSITYESEINRIFDFFNANEMAEQFVNGQISNIQFMTNIQTHTALDLNVVQYIRR